MGRSPVMVVPWLGGDGGALAGNGPDLELAAECGEAVGHVPMA